MIVPNVADFLVYCDNQAGNEIQCPQCGECMIPDNNGSTIRDLIGAASEHARLAHPLSAPAIMIAP